MKNMKMTKKMITKKKITMAKNSIFFYYIFTILFTIPLYSNEQSLFEAIIRNDAQSVEYMIKHRADVTITNNEGLTLLHLVSDPRLALILIKNGADINATNRIGSTPLHWAVSRNYEIIAKLLLEFGADPNTPDNNGNTPLHFAINSNEEVILLLIRSGANVNAINNEGSTPLIEALVKNNNTHSKYLILAGAEDIKNKAGISPSILETLEKQDSLKDTLISGQVDPLIKEIFVENYPQAINLIVQNAPINNVDVNGNTPLHWAFNKKQRYLSQLLLQKNADYKAFNYNDQNPIDVLLDTRDDNFIQYIQDLLKDKTNFYDPKKKEKSLDK
ncbi:MAG: ankyrin repeat domain-containing protein [Brevinema sp.]